MHHLSPLSRRKTLSLERSEGCQDLVRFFALLRIKPHAPPLVRAPVNSFEFQPCGRTPQAVHLLRLLATLSLTPTSSVHSLLCGLPGYLILFDTRTFELKRQLRSRQLPSQSEFFVISKHFTATRRIPPALCTLKHDSSRCNPGVEHLHFTTRLTCGLRSL